MFPLVFWCESFLKVELFLTNQELDSFPLISSLPSPSPFVLVITEYLYLFTMFLGTGTKAALDTNIVYHSIYTTKYNSASCFRQLMCSCFLLSSPNPLNYLVSLFVSSYRSSSNLSALCFHLDLYIILKYIIMLSFWFVHHPGWSAQTMLIAFLLSCVTTHLFYLKNNRVA